MRGTAGTRGPWVKQDQLVQLMSDLFAPVDQLWPKCAVEVWAERSSLHICVPN